MKVRLTGRYVIVQEYDKEAGGVIVSEVGGSLLSVNCTDAVCPAKHTCGFVTAIVRGARMVTSHVSGCGFGLKD